MKAIIFDFDGTLADSGACGLLATQRAFQECHVAVPSKEQVDYYMGIPIEQSFQEMTNHSLNDEQFNELLRRFRQAYKELEPQTITAFPHIDEVLHTLKQRGYQLFVVSSKKTDVLHRNLQALKLAHFFTDWIGSDQVTNYKPHPEGILTITARHSINVADCIMIGDATFDIQMGKAAGCQTVAVGWGSHTKAQLLAEEPNFYVEDVPELQKVI